MDGITRSITLEAETSLPTEFGTFVVKIYRAPNGDTSTAIVSGKTEGCHDLPVRVHSACFTSEVLGSLKCDCKEQLDFALQYIAKHDGVVLYLQQEGRGIGLGNKIRAYALQEQGHDTIEANTLLGLPVDARTYDEAADILRDLGVGSIRLMTNNPLKISALKDLGITVSGREPVTIRANEHSAGYLQTKREQMGHLLTLSSTIDPKNNRENLPEKPNKTSQRPLVHINFALSESGLTTTQNGSQTAISCQADWQRVHQLREKYAAVAVGAKTWLNDKPQLTSRSDRLGRKPQRQPDRVIFAGRHLCPYTPVNRRTFIIGKSTTEQTEHSALINAADHDLTSPLRSLYNRRIDSLLVEGGLTLVRSFIRQQVADVITIYVKTQCLETAVRAAAQALPEFSAELCNARHFGDGVLLSSGGHSLAVPQPADQAAYG